MVTPGTAVRQRTIVVIVLCACVAVLTLVSLGVGPVTLSPVAVLDALFGGGSEVQRVIVQEIRLPRAILALAIGAILGLSGAALQGLLRNPLASPSLFGAPQAAAFGAVPTISLGLADMLSFALPVAAIVGAFASVFVLLAVAGRNASLLILILAGLALSSLAGAATALALNLSPNPFAALEIAFWLLGSLEDRSLRHVDAGAAFHRCAAAILLIQRHAFRALTLAKRRRRALGWMSAACGSSSSSASRLGSAASVAVAGTIGFIGLVARTSCVRSSATTRRGSCAERARRRRAAARRRRRGANHSVDHATSRSACSPRSSACRSSCT